MHIRNQKKQRSNIQEEKSRQGALSSNCRIEDLCIGKANIHRNDLTRRIHRDFAYDPTATTASTPLTQVWEQRRGVCQDFAHLAIAMLRSIGLGAGYVSGYLETLPPPGQPKLVGADASHAWFSLHVPEIGWVEFDPTNDQMPTEQYVVIARGRDYSDVPPLKGVIYGGGQHSIQVSVDVHPLEDGERGSAALD